MITDIRRGLSNPPLIGRELNRLFYKYRGHPFPTKDYFESDWDNLIILDGCRYDLFIESEANWNAKPVYSPASNTSEFLKMVFGNRTLLDTIYITANPQYYRYRSEICTDFYDVFDLWMGPSWDDEIGTVPPEEITDVSLNVYENNPDKRLIVHYMQPHFPFLDSDINSGVVSRPNQETENFWTEMMRDNLAIRKEELWNAYLNNLNYALTYVKKLVDVISGTTVITSDHGNMLGERSRPIPTREWGHPQGIFTEELTKVPWVNILGDRAEPIIPEKKKAANDTKKMDTALERLSDLGYRT